MTTQKTLIEFINEHLHRAGWDPVNTDEIVSEKQEEIKPSGPKPIDSDSGAVETEIITIGLKPGDKIAAVLQASSGFDDPINGQEHVIKSAQEIQKQQGGELPRCFITDGKELYYWGSQLYPPVKIHGFPTKEDLLWMKWSEEKRSNQRGLEPSQGFSLSEPYDKAVQSVFHRIDADKGNSLIVMEGTTGKIVVGLSLCSTLLATDRARRMLYIVNNAMLREHVLLTWSHRLPDKTFWPDEPGEVFKPDRSLYVMSARGLQMIVQAMNDTGTYISPFFFDGIIFDFFNNDPDSMPKEILDYFKAVTIGITTLQPEDIKPEIYKEFGCYVGEPVFAYSRTAAHSLDPPALCRIEVERAHPKFRIDGIVGPTLPPPVLQYFEQSGQTPGTVDFQGTELERKVINAPTNGTIVREFMENSIKDADGVLPGKTVLFALSKEHARRLQDLFDRFFPDYAGRFARVYDKDHHATRGSGGLLDRFLCESFPRVAIVADGFDWDFQIPEVVNVVIARPVFDKAAFERMVEIGTACLPGESEDNGKTWCTQKDRCLIFDCWGGFEFFHENPTIRDTGISHPAIRQFRAWLHFMAASLSFDDQERRDTVIGNIRSEIRSLVEDDTTLADLPAFATVRDEAFWKNPDDQSISFIKETIMPFFERRRVENPQEVEFRSDIIDLKAALLCKNQDLVDTLREIIVAQVLDLPSSQNEVLRERDLVDAVQYSTWWVSPTEQNLDRLIARLAPLMKYREHRSEPLQKYTISDLITMEQKFEYGPDQERISGWEYRKRIRNHITERVPGNSFIRKILLGEKVAHTEIVKASELLSTEEPFLTDDVLETIYDLRNPRFMHVVRYVLDIEPLESWSDSVYHSVAEFLSTRTEMTVKQVQFLHTLRSFIIQKKAMRRADLKELPFTRIHPEGILGVFSQAEAQEIIAFAEALVIS